MQGISRQRDDGECKCVSVAGVARRYGCSVPLNPAQGVGRELGQNKSRVLTIAKSATASAQAVYSAT
jgi:hypothetical protein